MESTGSNVDSEKSIILYGLVVSRKQYGAYEPYVLISQVITKESHEDFTEEELFPISQVTYEDKARSGAYGNITVQLKIGVTKRINFEEMEAGLLL